MDDATLDATTRSWVFQALRDITGAGIGSDPAAWRAWWSQHSRAGSTCRNIDVRLCAIPKGRVVAYTPAT
jgi:hypothetical protein